MANINPMKDVLAKDMDRRQFLGFMGAAALVVTGASGVIGGLSKLGSKPVTRGYGSSAYGGGTDATKNRVS